MRYNKTIIQSIPLSRRLLHGRRTAEPGFIPNRSYAYRGTIFNYKEQYVATVRLIFSIPLDRSEVPENAPEVNPVIIVLVEDTTLSPLEIVDFEQAMTPILAKRLASEYFQPDRIMYFYPSPADGAETKDKK